MRLPDYKLQVIECLLIDDDDNSVHARPGYLAVSSLTYSFFEQGHLDGGLKLKSIYDSRNREDLIACQATFSKSSKMDMNPFEREIKWMGELNKNHVGLIEVKLVEDYSECSVELSFDDETWILAPLDCERQPIFEIQAASVLSACASDIEKRSLFG